MDQFSPKHYVFLMMAVGIVSMKTYPIVFIRESGRDSWIAVILSSVLAVFYFLFAIKTMMRSKDETLRKIYETAFGKPAGICLLILFAGNVFLTMVESASIEADSMHQNMLVETPNWYFLLFFVLPALYVVRRDLVAVVIVAIIGISLILIAGIHLGILTVQQKHITYLFPVFENGVTGGFWISVAKSLGMYGFLSISFAYLPRIQYKRDTLKKYAAIGLAIIVQMQIVSVTGIFMTFSVPVAESYYYPKLIQTHLVSYFRMLEFGELYVMLQTLGGFLMKYLVSFHALIQIMQSFQIKGSMIRVSTYLFTALVMAAAYFATYTSVRLFALLEFLPWICLFNFILVPTAAFAIYRVKRKKAQPPGQQAAA